jgi:hypothetical protein
MNNPNADACLFFGYGYYNKYNKIPSILFADWTYEIELDRQKRSPNFMEKRYIRQERNAISNANLSVLVCMPFFLIGVYLKKIKQQLCKLHNCCFEVGLLICAFLLLMICGNYNGYVWMYLCDYGNNYALFIIGGMAGTCMLYVLSLWLSRLPYRKTIEALSKGSILIIGLHIIIVRRLIELPDRSLIEDLFLSLFILLCFVPLIRITELFFPILLGKHK